MEWLSSYLFTEQRKAFIGFIMRFDEFALPATVGEAIHLALAYADVFDYPLTEPEILRYLPGLPATLEDVSSQLHAHPDSFPSRDGFFTLPGRECLVAIRRKREKASHLLWRQAQFYGEQIARLPFVRMVAVTGALAVSNAEAGSDLDFLIVTEPGRLWSCRAAVLLLGRVAARRGVTLCPNYLISLHALEFPDKNLYAAHELAQMVPLSGLAIYAAIRAKNTWVDKCLPNATGMPGLPIQGSNRKPAPGRPWLEALLRTAPFNALENWEMKRKIRKLRREQGHSPETEFSPDICKGHAHRHQARTYRELQARLLSG